MNRIVIDRPRRARWRWPAPPAQAQEKQQLAFVVNAASDFWKLAEAGVAEGAGRAARLRAAVPLSGARAPRRCRTR